MQTVATPDGVDLAVHDLGGQGPPLLMVHGTGLCGQVWRPFAAALADRFHCHALDLRGHGRSSAPVDTTYHWDGFVTDVLAVIDGMGWDGQEVLGVGHSLGGATLLRTRLARPGTFSRLWLWEPIVFPDPGIEVPIVEVALRRRRRFPSAQVARASWAAKPPFAPFHPDALDGYVEGGLRPADDGDGVVLSCEPEHEAQVFRMGPAADTWQRLEQVEGPVAVLTGGRTDAIVPRMAEVLAERMPDARPIVHAELDHFGPFTHPADLADQAAEILGA